MGKGRTGTGRGRSPAGKGRTAKVGSRVRKNGLFRSLSVLAVILLVLAYRLFTGSPDPQGRDAAAFRNGAENILEVHYLDVGQGDATLILCEGHAMLIDAGENDKGTAVQLYLKKHGVEALDYLIGTHPDSDHIGGLDVILSKFEVGTVILPEYAKDTKTYRDVLQAMKEKDYRNTPPEVGKRYALGGAFFTVTAPNREDYGEETNNYSVGILLQYGQNRFLFTGDAEEEAERDMLENGLDLSADVYKAGHHGSRTSSGREFLEAVSPAFAVISCGENNSYGFPHAQTLNSLRAKGVEVFRTDEQGTVVAVSDGGKITWNCAPAEDWTAGEPTGSGGDGKAGTAESSGLQTEEENRAEEENRTEEESRTEKNRTEEESRTEKNRTEEESRTEKNRTEEESRTEKNRTEEESRTEENRTEKETWKADREETYILNRKSKKFHLPGCSSVEDMRSSNRLESELPREELIAGGYEPCRRCDP